MENNLLVMIAGVVLSLAFGYVPGLREWYAALDGVRKAQVMACVLLASAVGVFAAACYSPWQEEVALVSTFSSKDKWCRVESAPVGRHLAACL